MPSWLGSGRDPVAPRLARAAIALAMLLLAIGGLVLVGRRAVGALQIAPPAPALATAGAILAAAALTFRRLLVSAGDRSRRAVAIWVAPSLVLLTWACALGLGASSGPSLLLLFAPLLVEEGWSWGRFTAGSSAAAQPPDAPRASPPAAELVRAEPSTPASLAVLADEIDAESESRDASVTQQQTRRQDAELGEVIDGWVRVDFAAAQRHAAAHLAICPPMAADPVCYAEPAEGPDATVKVTQSLSYGVRLEVKLDGPAAEPTSVLVEFSIQEHASSE